MNVSNLTVELNKITFDTLENVKEIVQEFVNKQGHNRCWYYPDLFNKLANELGIETKAPELPTRHEFELGCLKYQNEQFGNNE